MGKEKVIHIALSTTSHKRTCTNSDLKHTDREKTFFSHKVNLFVSFSLSITVPGTNGKIKSVAHLPLDKSICYFQC